MNLMWIHTVGVKTFGALRRLMVIPRAGQVRGVRPISTGSGVMLATSQAPKMAF